MRAAGVIALAGGLALGAAAAASAQTVKAQKRRELTDVQKQLEQTRRDIEQYKQQEQALGQDLQKIQSRTGESRRKLE